MTRVRKFAKFVLALAQVTVLTFVAATIVDPSLGWWLRAKQDPYAVIFALLIGAYITHGLRSALPTPDDDWD